jgi:ATP-dependent RNA helicase DeaD
LQNIERTVRTRLELAQIPTITDLRERRMELLRASLRDALHEDGLDRFRPVIEPLLDEFDVIDVALAALSLAEQAAAKDGTEDADIAAASFFDRAESRGKRPPGGLPGRGPAGRPGPRARGPGVRAAPDGPWTRLFIGAGRKSGMSPGDLVGAITGEAGVSGSSVGAIQIADGYSLVEVPEARADDIVRALSAATIKGRRLPVRREREG